MALRATLRHETRRLFKQSVVILSTAKDLQFQI